MDLSGRAKTPNASRYLQQRCKHWGHRFTATFDSTRGNVDFGDGSSVDLEAPPYVLVVKIHGSAESMDEFRQVVEEHVDRFAHREGSLTFDWG